MQRQGLQRLSTIFTTVLLSATLCAFTKSEANTGMEEHVIREVIAVGDIESPSELVGIPSYFDSAEKIVNEPALNRTEPAAQVMLEPHSKSKTVARLNNGHPVKVLKSQKDWLKISWTTDDTLNQGWLKKTFVEKNAIHAHR